MEESMKVLATIDLEGVAGYVKWDTADRQREREFITADVNAAIEGAFAGGATDVLVTEAHANMRNIIPEKFDKRATMLIGQPKPFNHMAGVDESFDAAMFVGYHARAGALHAVMCHTYTFGVFSLKLNGIEVGEFGCDAAVCGHFGVPVVMVSGDRAACDEAAALVPGIEGVCVKEGIGKFAARCLPPEKARELITAGASKALGSAADSKPFVVDPPITVEVTFHDPWHADGVAYLPFIERRDGRTIVFEAPDMAQAYLYFDALHFLAGHP